jgi:hypothetical protein
MHLILPYLPHTEVALFIEPDTGRYNLKFDYFTIFEDVWLEDLEIKVSVVCDASLSLSQYFRPFSSSSFSSLLSPSLFVHSSSPFVASSTLFSPSDLSSS